MAVLIVPGDPFDPRLPDEHFAAEADAAGTLGVDVVTFDDTQTSGGALRGGASADFSDAVYRGWMLDETGMRLLDTAVEKRGGSLRTTVKQYLAAHQLPGWYGHFAALTAETVWTDAGDFAALEKALQRFGSAPVIVKDYVKSEKHYWDEACYVPDASDLDHAFKVIERFKQLRGDNLAGGIVIRRFETYQGAEARLWWIGGALAVVSAHPDTPDQLPNPEIPDGLAETVAAFGSPFITTDLALRDDGLWRLVEVGDGQVSDRPESLPAAQLASQVMSLGSPLRSTRH